MSKLGGLEMLKICIIGSPGSGKSTLAKQLGKILGIEAIHLDSLFWKPGWIASSMEELSEMQALHFQKNSWIFDGNYSRIWNARLEQADTIIFLDLPRIICFFRVLQRFWQNRNQSRSDIGKDCPEKIDLPFLWFVWTYPRQRKWKALEVTKEYKNRKQVFILRSKKEVNSFLKQVHGANMYGVR